MSMMWCTRLLAWWNKTGGHVGLPMSQLGVSEQFPNHKTRLQICPQYMFGNYPPQMVSKSWFPGFCFDSGPNLQPNPVKGSELRSDSLRIQSAHLSFDGSIFDFVRNLRPAIFGVKIGAKGYVP